MIYHTLHYNTVQYNTNTNTIQYDTMQMQMQLQMQLQMQVQIQIQNIRYNTIQYKSFPHVLGRLPTWFYWDFRE